MWALSPTRALRVLAQFTDDAWSGGHYSFGNGGNVLNPHDMIAGAGTLPGWARIALVRYASNEDELQCGLAGCNAGPGSVEKYGGVPRMRRLRIM